MKTTCSFARRSSSRFVRSNRLTPTFSRRFCSHGPSHVSGKGHIRDMLKRNADWCAQTFKSEADIEAGCGPQVPLSTLITCSDARVPAVGAGIVAPNQTFTIRNIGNQVQNSAGSVRYGVQMLQTPFAVVMGHTGCGAIAGSAADYRKLPHQIQSEVVPLRRVHEFVATLPNAAEVESMELAERCDVYTEVNVDYQIQQLLRDDFVRQRVESGELTLVGVVYDLRNTYGRGHGRMHVVNVNGDMEPASIRKHAIFDSADVDFKDACVSRLFAYKPQDIDSVFS